VLFRSVVSGNYRKQDFTIYLQQVGLVSEDEKVEAVVTELDETDPFNTNTGEPTQLPEEE